MATSPAKLLIDFASFRKEGRENLSAGAGDGRVRGRVPRMLRRRDERVPLVPVGAGFIAAWFDYNGDGRQDIYLANDYLGKKPDRNHLWRNDGPKADGSWQFTDVSVDSGASFSMNSMGLGIGDYDRDLDLDLAISNFGPNRLLRNNGNPTFTDVGAEAKIERPDQRQGHKSEGETSLEVTWPTGSSRP